MRQPAKAFTSLLHQISPPGPYPCGHVPSGSETQVPRLTRKKQPRARNRLNFSGLVLTFVLTFTLSTTQSLMESSGGGEGS